MDQSKIYHNLYIKDTEGKPEDMPFISSLFQLWKTIFFLESIDNILIWGKLIHVQNYMHRKLYMFHTSTNNWFVRSKMGEAMLSTSSWKCCVRGGVGSMGREASGRRQVWLFFTSQCLYLEILRQCWGRGSKFDYTSSRLSVDIWKFYVSVGAEEVS